MPLKFMDLSRKDFIYAPKIGIVQFIILTILITDRFIYNLIQIEYIKYYQI